MKVLDSFEFKKRGRTINYKEEWFTGDIVKLTRKDLGLEADDNMTHTVQSLRKHAKTHYSSSLNTRVVDNGAALVMQAVAIEE